jgi:hypothetical protein
VPSLATSLVYWVMALTSLAPSFSNGVGQVDFIGDGDAVLGGGAAEGLVEDDAPVLWRSVTRGAIQDYSTGPWPDKLSVTPRR